MSGDKMHEGEFEVKLDLVSRLIAEQFPQWRNLPLHQVTSAGTDNALYRLGNEMVVRLPRINWAINAVKDEQNWLPILAPSLPTSIPVPLGLGKPGYGYPWHWSVYKWLEGENPVVGQIEDPASLATDLARFIRALQKIDTSGAPPSSRGIPLIERDADTRAAIAELVGMVDASAVTNAWEFALNLAPWSGPSVWIHGDLSFGNLLVLDGRLEAVIDFGSLGVGDPCSDLIVAWNLLSASARESFKTEMQVDDSTWKRGRGLALSIALIQLPYYVYRNPRLAENARHVINEVLADQRPDNET